MLDHGMDPSGPWTAALHYQRGNEFLIDDFYGEDVTRAAHRGHALGITRGASLRRADHRVDPESGACCGFGNRAKWRRRGVLGRRGTTLFSTRSKA
jgi:hypothetical protein